ncbi:MAG: IS1634 family transposase [Actinomycetales bacterium]|nr:IS1634 family transposase [Actinomycetales bacterium]
MAFIRRVRTTSGATAVQIAEYVDGRQRIVKHVGSAHTEVELGILMVRARELLGPDGQGALDLGVEASVPVTALLAGSGGGLTQPELFPATGAGAASGQAVTVGAGAASGQAVTVGAARVVATDTRVLFEALVGVYSSLGFDAVGDEVFRDLVIARIVEPTSLLDTARVLTDLGRAPASYATMRRTLARAIADPADPVDRGDRVETSGPRTRSYRERIAGLCFAHAVTGGDVSLCLYDVTTLYFEADAEDDLRKVGFSKERRVDPQIVVGLLVDRQGFPLEIGCFEGDTAETTTIVPIVKAFTARHQVADMVVVADAGMLSGKNLTALDTEHLHFIVGSRTTKAPLDLASHFRWNGDAFTDGQVIDTITARSAAHPENNPAVRDEPVWDRDQHTASWRAVWAYSAKRAARDGKTLTAQENRARAVIAGEKSARTPRFVKTKDGTTILDETALARARRLVGLKGYVTNIPADVMPAAEVISSYHDLWHVEQSFRMSKTDLRARPMFARTNDAIEAHLTIVFTALAVAREAQNRTGLSIRNLVRQLRTLRSATIAINGAVQTIPPAINPEQQALLDALQQPKPHALGK